MSNRRSFASYVPKWDRFQTSVAVASMKTSESPTNTIYQRQYSHVYANRLNELKKRFQKRDQIKLHYCERILDLVEDKLSFVSGTLVKEAGKDGLFDENDCKCRPDDVLALEDESGRIYLQTDRVHEYCTGVVVAVQGIVKEGGRLHVDHFEHPHDAPFKTSRSEMKASSSEDKEPHILLLSGLACGDPETSLLQRDMILAYLQGYLAVPTASKVCRIIIAGDSIFEGSVEGAKQLDDFLVQLCSSGIPVDILPGSHDPTTANWPQRPLHSSLIPQANAYGFDLLVKTPNPYASEISNKYILGTDGRNIEDLSLYIRRSPAEKLTELEVLKNTLRWSHVCPTGPDSVPTMPHAESDPMIIATQPNLYFSGNCTKFQTEMVSSLSNGSANSTRLVCIPRFAKTGEVVLVNMNSLDCKLLRFEDDFSGDT
mmetsp:Transcript_22947/g.26169  ORF Transcript_22947/g.26169 Transcript_22947/m.26169 type:complete len:428 (+) Transcript_22947:70-1353(+)